MDTGDISYLHHAGSIIQDPGLQALVHGRILPRGSHGCRPGKVQGAICHCICSRAGCGCGIFHRQGSGSRTAESAVCALCMLSVLQGPYLLRCIDGIPAASAGSNVLCRAGDVKKGYHWWSDTTVPCRLYTVIQQGRLGEPHSRCCNGTDTLDQDARKAALYISSTVHCSACPVCRLDMAEDGQHHPGLIG